MNHRRLHALAIATAMLGGCTTLAPQPSTPHPPAPARPTVSQIVIDTKSWLGPGEYWAISNTGAWYHRSASGSPNAIVTTETRFTPAPTDENFAAIRASLTSIESLLVQGIPCVDGIATDQDTTEIAWYNGVNHSSVGWYWGCQSPNMDAVKASPGRAITSSRSTAAAAE